MQPDFRENHLRVIYSFLDYLNSRTDNFVLKGGTALLTCYGLDRFSEDIDLDSKNPLFVQYVDEFCSLHKFEYHIQKDTDTVKRVQIHYPSPIKNPLKVEVSYRTPQIDKTDTTSINGISVYTIDKIADLKAAAYTGREKLRDLYDVAFICNNYFEQLSKPVLEHLHSALVQKGIEQFDYLNQTQKDPLIDPNKLAIDFFEAYLKLEEFCTGDKSPIKDLAENAKNSIDDRENVDNGLGGNPGGGPAER